MQMWKPWKETEGEELSLKFVLSHPLDETGMNLLRENDVEIYIGYSADPYSYFDQLKTADAFIIRLAKCGAEVLDSCPKLKVIGRTGVGFDTINAVRAKQLGIPIVLTPGANKRSVAEHVLALMFALSKNICQADRELRAGNWQIRDAGKSIELEGRKIGIIGMGAIGREVARLCQGIGMETAGLDPFCPENIEAAGCQRYDDLDALLQDCDVVTIHVPLTPETREMISVRELALMKPNALLINTSRAPIVNTRALVDAVNNKKIAGAGVDVYDEEPAQLSNPIFTGTNIICTPHAAALTAESNARMAYQCAQGCLAVCRGEKWPYVADQTVYNHPRFI